MPSALPLGAFYFAFFVCTGLSVAYFPPYLAARGLTAGEIAWVLALPQLARVLAPGAWGALADRTGALRAIVVVASVANVACFALLPAMPGFVAIAWLVGLTSVAASAALPLVEAMTFAALGGESGRYGPIRLWGSIGFIAAVLAGGVWLEPRALDLLPYALLACAGATLCVAGALPSTRVHIAAPAIAITRPAAALLAAALCMSIAHGTLYAFFTLHLQRLGYGGALIGVLWTLGVLAEIAVFLLLPALFRRYALSSVLMVSAACGVLRFLAIAWLADWLLLLVAAQLLHAATFGSFHAAAVAAVQRVFPPGAQARGQALFSSIGYGAGGALGALLAGWAWQTAGPGVAFTVSAGACLMGLFFAYPLKRAGL